jgi:hypothetical protein
MCDRSMRQRVGLQVRVLRFGPLRKGDVWIGVFPEGKEILAGGEGLGECGGIRCRALLGANGRGARSHMNRSRMNRSCMNRSCVNRSHMNRSCVNRGLGLGTQFGA